MSNGKICTCGHTYRRHEDTKPHGCWAPGCDCFQFAPQEATKAPEAEPTSESKRLAYLETWQIDACAAFDAIMLLEDAGTWLTFQDVVDAVSNSRPAPAAPVTSPPEFPDSSSPSVFPNNSRAPVTREARKALAMDFGRLHGMIDGSRSMNPEAMLERKKDREALKRIESIAARLLGEAPSPPARPMKLRVNTEYWGPYSDRLSIETEESGSVVDIVVRSLAKEIAYRIKYFEAPATGGKE